MVEEAHTETLQPARTYKGAFLLRQSGGRQGRGPGEEALRLCVILRLRQQT